MIKIPKNIQHLNPYKPGMSTEELANAKKLKRIVKLASNENPRGASHMGMEMLQKVTEQSSLYPNPSAPYLVQTLSESLCVSSKQIVCGSGIDSLLASIIIAFSSENDEILTSEGTFIGIYVHARKYGRKLTKIPLKKWTYDLDTILDSITERTKIIYIANPNNPTGTMFLRPQFEIFFEKVPKDVLVVLDEAYEDYAYYHPEYAEGLDFLNENLITLRTFSKAYGLAGLRVGYAVASCKLIAELYKVKLPFEPNRIAQFCAAAAFLDYDFVYETLCLNKKILGMMYKFFQYIELPFIKSFTNFVMLILPSTEIALKFTDRCLDYGLILRHLGSFGIPNAIRITTGTEEDTLYAFRVIKRVWTECQ